MTFRKLIYWPHLICGVLAGIVIFILSASGALLTYERQIIAWGERTYYSEPTSNATSLSMEQIAGIARSQMNEAEIRSINIENDPAAPIVVRGDKYYYINRYSGEVLGNGPQEIRDFFYSAMLFHRWFLLEGENRGTARIITAGANLVFFFIVLSGMYLWLPKVYKWANFKKFLFFQKTTNSHARDFNWHHVMGIWSALPLLLIIASGSWFYFDWADRLGDYIAGDAPAINGAPAVSEATTGPVNLDTMFDSAVAQQPGWHIISMNAPKAEDTGVKFIIDKSKGGQPLQIGELTLNRQSGQIDVWHPFENYAAERKMTNFLRYGHTGEFFGILGQTIAGLVSIFATIMVWTGLSLAYRRYVTPWLSRKSKR
ncbi:MAG: PepSY domain-containing protein [Kordiimonadaceae bacterium]|jgi:uncharacterized iron-regulated membrane protein|nr:PepSY domain-containing protein [Kordiimonadaceae bacterium]MBT6034903.1 PepSY domain-containing protein [Kordiimonadaceae bacterium]MBT6330935.1 PepSY domain-containing protein [Kordiimonadaceae bacterium]MBT7581508.1 PepSY domain-containing protein [Kordiimonadaceae bacterium]